MSPCWELQKLKVPPPLGGSLTRTVKAGWYSSYQLRYILFLWTIKGEISKGSLDRQSRMFFFVGLQFYSTVSIPKCCIILLPNEVCQNDCFCQFSREHSEKSLRYITIEFSVALSTIVANTCKKFQIEWPRRRQKKPRLNVLPRSQFRQCHGHTRLSYAREHQRFLWGGRFAFCMQSLSWRSYLATDYIQMQA